MKQPSRPWLAVLVLVPGAMAWPSWSLAQPVASAATVDHVIVGVADLDRGIAELAALTGVAPVFGGRHPGRGTQNALLSLGPRTYLELLAPSDEADAEVRSSFARFHEATPIGWAVGTGDLEGLARRLGARGIKVGEPVPGSRVQPGGGVLKWRTAGPTDLKSDLLPFFIQWSPETAHPATTSPAGCRLETLTLTESAPEPLEKLVQALGLTLTIQRGTPAVLRIALTCPRGRVELGAHPSPQALLDRAKQASGGGAWDRVTTTHTRAGLETGGLKGTAESWEDVRTGRSVARYQLGPITGAGGFDGKSVWSQDASRQVRIEEGGEAREGAANDAYRAALGYFFPERWPADLEYAGEKTDGDRRFLVVRGTPKGGRPFEIWIDATTSLIDRTVEKTAIETRTVFFSDYRDVEGVRVPFASRSTNGEEKYDQRVTVETVELDKPVDDSLFAPPAPPPPDFAIAGGTSTTVPFELLNNHIYVQVELNGKGPFRLLCDTGGANIVTPELAQELGLKPEGALQGRGAGEGSEDVGLVTVDSLRVGDATVQKQVFAVYPLGALARVEGVASGGLVGYEIFKRFVATIDYERSRLTLTVPSAFEYEGKGTVVPFKFNQHIPQVEGEIDGVSGKFDIDTGSRSSLDLLGPFVEKNGLRAKYAPKVEGVTGWGVGGPVRTAVTRARVLKLGSVVVDSPVTELALQQKGAFTDPYVAGNVGAGVLKRFNIVFDYERQRLIFEPNANDAKRDVFDRAGVWMGEADGAYEVMDVITGAPGAEAGLKAGDRIVAVDGKPASSVPLPALRQRFKSDPPGTRVRLRVRSGGAEREVVLTLRDIV